MVYTDKETFRKEMQRMGRLAGRMVTVEDVDAYYKYLQHYKVETLSRAIDKAYRDRDPDDVFLNTQMLRANEIKTAADRILEIEGGEKTFGCPKTMRHLCRISRSRGLGQVRIFWWATMLLAKSSARTTGATTSGDCVTRKRL